MANEPEIDLNNLPAKAAAAITALDNVMTFTAAGETTQTPFNEAVAQANALNDCYCIKSATVTIPTADVLTGTTVFFGINPPVGKYIKPLSIDFKALYNSVTYAGLKTIEVWMFGAGQAIYTANILGFTINTFVPLALNFATTDTTYKDGVDMYVTIPVGTTLGDSDVSVVVTYLLLDTPT